MRYWDGVSWAGQTTESNAFAAPLLHQPSPSVDTFDAGATRSSGLSTGGVIGIVASAVLATAALVGAVTALVAMTSHGDNFALNSSPSASATPIEATAPLENEEPTTGAFDQDSLPFELESGQETTTWMLRYDVGTLDVPSSARDVTRSAIERLKGDTSYIGGVWSFDGLSWTATESYLYAEVWSYDSAPVETLEEVADAYYASYYEDLGFDVTPIALETHPLGYEMASFEVTGLDDAFLGTGESIPVRHSIVLLRDGQQEVALSLFRLGAKDDNVVMQWDGEFDTVVQSFRFWEDIDK